MTKNYNLRFTLLAALLLVSSFATQAQAHQAQAHMRTDRWDISRSVFPNSYYDDGPNSPSHSAYTMGNGRSASEYGGD